MIIDGKKIASSILDNLKHEIAKHTIKPGLVFILVGNDFASQKYVSMKEKACAKVGIKSTVLRLPAFVTQEQLLTEIQRFNQDQAIDGILVQMPLPPQLDPRVVTAAIAPEKDVDGFHPTNLGKLVIGDLSGLIPCTPKGIMTLLEKSDIAIEKKHAVVLGRSLIVGKPMALLLMNKGKMGNATVTLAHSYTEDLPSITRQADILIVALGKPKFIQEDMVKPGAVIIDVGINYENGKIVGDVDFENVATLCKAISPVPGGVGPMTIASLMENTYKSFTQRKRTI